MKRNEGEQFSGRLRRCVDGLKKARPEGFEPPTP